MTPQSPRILLLGGHGKVSLYLTPKILARSWNLISVIRNPDQKSTILEAGKNGPGKVDVLVSSLEDVKSDVDAQKILDQTRPDWVVWSAGAGGKGGPERTNAIDRDAAIHIIKTSISTPSVKKILLISALSIRRNRAPWWTEEGWESVQKVNTEILPVYYKAKLAADEVLTVLGEERMNRDKGFSYVILRPGILTDGEETGKVQLGRTGARDSVSRKDVAEVAVRLLEREGSRGWVDLLNGTEEVGVAVERIVGEGIDSREGEDLETMKGSI